MTENRRTTLYDVARRANVSYQTVSRVVNNHPSVSEDTKARVQTAVAELNYRPNRAAQSLAGTKSRTLAMTTYGLDNYGPAQIVVSIEQACREAGYDLIFTNMIGHQLTHLRDAINYIRRWEIDGLMLISPVEGLSYGEITALCDNIPVVLVGTRMGLNAPSVVVDQKEGTRLITQHLIDLGHERVCEISGPMQWFDAQERHESWLTALHKAGLTGGASVEGKWTAESGYHAARKLLKSGEKFTALVVGNDQMALGAIHAIREAGLRVPEDISITGFDDIPEATYISPPLTTVCQDFALVGRTGVQNLITRIKTPEEPETQTVVAPRLMIRQSSGIRA